MERDELLGIILIVLSISQLISLLLMHNVSSKLKNIDQLYGGDIDRLNKDINRFNKDINYHNTQLSLILDSIAQLDSQKSEKRTWLNKHKPIKDSLV